MGLTDDLQGTTDQSPEPQPPLSAPVQQPVVIQMPAPRRQQPQPRRPPQPQSVLARWLPAGAERVKIWKRGAPAPGEVVGRPQYIGSYSNDDFNGHDSLEDFIKRRLVPEFEYGEYEAARCDAAGAEVPGTRQSYPIAAPRHLAQPQAALPAGDPNAVALAAYTDWLRATLRPGAAPAMGAPQIPAGVDPRTADLLRGIGDSLAAIRSGAGASDPFFTREFAMRALDRLERATLPQPTATLPALPPFSAADSATVARDAAREAVREALAAQQSQRSVVDELKAAKELFAAPVAAPQPSVSDRIAEFRALSELFGMSQVRADLESVKQTLSQNPDPEDEIDKHIRLVEKIERYKRLTSSPMAAITSSPETFGSYLNSTIQGLATAMREIRLATEATERRESVRAGHAPVALLPAAAPSASAPPVAPPAPAPTQAPAPAPAPAHQAPAPYPTGFQPYLLAIQRAEGIEARVRSTLAGFQFLGQREPWKPYFDAAMDMARRRDQQAIKVIFAVLNDIAQRGDLTEAQVNMIVGDFQTWWDAIVDRIFDSTSAQA